jgi:hypothetical protein
MSGFKTHMLLVRTVHLRNPDLSRMKTDLDFIRGLAQTDPSFMKLGNSPPNYESALYLA